jgi:hypothetical protein
MVRNFKELQAKMDPERRARVEKRVQKALKEIPSALALKTESKQEAGAPASAQSHRA